MLGHLRLLAVVCCEHDQTDFLKAVRFSLTTPRDISKIRAFYFSYYFGYVDLCISKYLRICGYVFQKKNFEIQIRTRIRVWIFCCVISTYQLLIDSSSGSLRNLNQKNVVYHEKIEHLPIPSSRQVWLLGFKSNTGEQCYRKKRNLSASLHQFF